MNIEVVEVSLADLVFPGIIDKSTSGFVYEHLKHYCSKFRPLPAITVSSDGKRLIIAGRHLYALIARDLGDDRIRAILKGTTFEELQEQDVPGLLARVPNEVLERELRDDVPNHWHVFFFKSQPDEKIITQIDSRFRSFLNQSLPAMITNTDNLQILSNFDAIGPYFEIRFPTPVANSQWAASYHTFIISISRELSAIATYQGRRFED